MGPGPGRNRKSDLLETAGWDMANPRPAPSRTVTDRPALLRDIAARRRRAQLAARHALDGQASGGAVGSLAS